MSEQSSKEMQKKAAVQIKISIREAISALDEVGIQILTVVNAEGKLLGTVTEGDIRRGFLNGLSIDSSIEQVVNHTPLVVTRHIDVSLVRQLMQVNKILQIPIVDENGMLLGVHLWDELDQPKVLSNTLVVMCGGKGQRMLPFTETCPKPMLKVGGKPILQHIIERAKHEGFQNIVLSINYLGDQIESFFASGEQFGVQITYLREEKPLGTAGSLALMNQALDRPILVTNGDVISELRYADILDFHVQQNATATMAIKSHEWQNPFGVVDLDGLEICGFKEKPVIKSYINAGVYVLEPIVLKHLPQEEVFDMPVVFENLKTMNKKIVAYPMHELWLDVGRPSDLTDANKVIGE